MSKVEKRKELNNGIELYPVKELRENYYDKIINIKDKQKAIFN